MATSDNKVEIEISARDTAGPVIKGVADDMGLIAPSAQKAQGSADGALDSMYKRGIKASEAAKSISEQLAFVQNAYVALQATQGMQAMAADLARTADAYNNLQARIKLTTGEGAAFATAFEGIAAVAQRTSSSLDATGTLFTKIAEAGKQMGVGQTEALKLTETINQAVQLSGASAQASDAAITQLIQGLQGGVLRGDEFNSVMEQAPRLSKAMADGLGVTTGQLRKMAEDGKLTSDVVISALKNQSDTVGSEFAKLPPTVGRALQQLSNSWTLYVGETDKASGASTAAASAIGALATNLKTISGYLIDAGQAALAYTGYKLAESFLSSATAAKATAAAVATSTAATVAESAAVAANTAALAVNKIERDAMGMAVNKLAPALTGNAAAMAGMGKELADTSTRYGENKVQLAALGTELAGTTGKVKSVWQELNVFKGVTTSIGSVASGAFSIAGTAAKGFASLLGGIPGIALLVLSNVKDIGTWMGEFVAKHTAAGKQLQANEAALAAIGEKSKTAAQDRAKAEDELNVARAKSVKAQADAHKAAQDYIPVVEKMVKVAEAQATAELAMVKISGDEVAIRKVSAEQGLIVAAARDKEAAANATLVTSIEAQIAAIKNQATATAPLTALQKDQIKDLEKLLIDKQQDAEKSAAAAAAARTEAAARAVLSDSYKDNSAKVAQYRQDLENAKSKLDILSKSGVASLDQIQAAQLEVNTASGKYNDALGDTVRAIEVKTVASKQELAISQSVIGAQIAQSKASQELAIASKNYATAIAEAVKQIKLQAELGAQQLAAQKTELKNTIELNAAKLEQAKASGTLTPAMQAELEASTKLAEAKLKEADATKKAGEQQAIATGLTNTAAAATKTVDDASKGLTSTVSAETKAKIDNAQAGVESAQAKYEDAKASGDEMGAAEALVKVKEAELELAKVMAAAKHEEAAASRKLADAKKAEAQVAIETANAIAAEIAKAEVVTAAMKAQAAAANVNAVAKAGAAKEAYAHADALDVEAKSADKAVKTAERALSSAKGALDDVHKSAANAAGAVGELAKAFDPMEEINNKVSYLAANLNEAGNTAYDLQAASAMAANSVARVGEQNLSTLRAAIDSATQKMQGMADAAKNALASVQDELDQLNANYDDIEKRKYEARLKELQAMLDQARSEGNASAMIDLQQAIDKTRQLYEGYKIPEATRKEITDGNLDSLKNASGKSQAQTDADQAAAARRRNIDAAKAAADKATADKTATNTAATQPANTTHTYTVNIPNYGTVNVASASDASSLTSILEQLARAKASAG